jgi:hypothetical protein
MNFTNQGTIRLLTLGLVAGLLPGADLRTASGQQPPPVFPQRIENPTIDPNAYPDGHPLKSFLTEHQSLGKPSTLAEPGARDDELTKLRKERYQSARRELESRLNLFNAGSARGTLDDVLAAIRRVADTEFALAGTPAARLAAIERRVTFAKGAEWVSETRFKASQIPIQDLDFSTYERLDAQITLLELKRSLAGPAEKPAALVAPPTKGPAPQRPAPSSAEPNIDWIFTFDETSFPDAPPALKAWGKELSQTNRSFTDSIATDDELTKLRKQRYQAARRRVQGKFNLFAAGSARGTLGTILEAQDRLIDAELALANDPNTRIAALARNVTAGKGLESVNATRYEARQIPIQDYDLTRIQRLNAEIRLLELKRSLTGLGTKPGTQAAPAAKGATPERPAPTPVEAPPDRLNDFVQALDGPPELKAWGMELDRDLQRNLALASPAAGNDEIARLRTERYQAAHRRLEANYNLFRAGSARGTVDLLLECHNRLMDEEIALANDSKTRMAILARKVTAAKGSHWVQDSRFKAGQIPPHDYEFSRFQRLDAEIKLLEFKQSLLPPKK